MVLEKSTTNTQTTNGTARAIQVGGRVRDIVFQSVRKYDNDFGPRFTFANLEKYDDCFGQKKVFANLETYDNFLGRKYRFANFEKYDNLLGPRFIFANLEKFLVRNIVLQTLKI